MRSSRTAHTVLQYVAVCTLLFAVVIASRLLAQENRPPGHQASPLGRDVLPRVAAKYGIPGLAVAQIEQGHIRDIEVYGVRDKATGAPVTERTIFEAGPLGEPAYAYAVLRLSAEGHFNPGTPLPTLFPLPYVRDFDPTSSAVATESLEDPRFNQITAFRVMNHTSGMPDWARNQHLRFLYPPGQKWSYSNEGYLYLQHVVEHVTAESFNDFVSRSVLQPARMVHSGFIWQEDFDRDMAAGYDRSGAPVERRRHSRPAAAATLYTSVRDYAQFITLLMISAPTQRAHESAVSLMLNPTTAVDAASMLSWGLGFGLEKNGDDVYFLHRDNGPGFQSFVIGSRKTGRAVVILTNSGNGLNAVPEIVDATIGGNHSALKSAFLRLP